MSFNNKVVLVTGGSSGIGAAIAYKFASEGANVAIVGRNEEKLKQVAQNCEKVGSKPLLIMADISKDESAKLILTQTINQYGKLDVLVNNAGIINDTSIFSDNLLESFDNIMNTNLRAVVNITNLAVKHIIQSKGNIINISSVVAKTVIANQKLAYCTSKAALDHFSKYIALELAPYGVRVNVINPGPVRTDIISNQTPDISKENENMFWTESAKLVPLNRVSQPEEIADLVLFLASDKAVAITGSSIVSDNGFLLVGPKYDKM